jgi:hypothetical protein
LGCYLLVALLSLTRLSSSAASPQVAVDLVDQPPALQFIVIIMRSIPFQFPV